MKLTLSEKSKLLQQSEIRNMSIECEKVGGVNLSQGVCDLETPSLVREGAKKAMDQGINHYTRYDGLLNLRQAIAKKMWEYNKVKVDPEENIIVSAGATGSFYCACLALLNPGDEVIIFEPYYGCHVNTLLAVEAKPVFITLLPPDWHFNIEEIKRKVTKKTKAIVINTPNNPTGKVFTRKELELLAEIAIRYDLFIFTDEIYEFFLYDGLNHISPASISEIFERTITISGYSKTFSITGWRIGHSISHQKWTQMIGYMNDLIYVCAPAPLQQGVAEGILNLSEEFYKKLETNIKRNEINYVKC